MSLHAERRSPSDSGTAGGTFFNRPDELWDVHGSTLFAMASALLGDEAHALRAVTVGVAELFKAPDREATLRSAASSVYHQCRGLLPQRATALELAMESSPLMASLRELAWSQRSALALCFYGGHTYQEAATELDISADRAAWLLLSGLQELGSPASP